jgi:hypothetical protein
MISLERKAGEDDQRSEPGVLGDMTDFRTALSNFLPLSLTAVKNLTGFLYVLLSNMLNQDD